MTSSSWYNEPDNPNAPIWRYMSLAKLVALLSDQKLFFCQVAKLPDPFEGCISEKLRSVISADFESHPHLSSWARARFTCYASCWCMGTTESDALWRIYGGADGGIAVRSTYAKMAAALFPSVNSGCVTYLDYANDEPPDPFNPVMIKRREYGYESECRFIWVHPDYSKIKLSEPDSLDLLTNLPEGHKESIDLDLAVDDVIVSPLAPDWFFEAVQATVQRFGSKIQVARSSLRTPPTHLLPRRKLSAIGADQRAL